MLVQSTSIQGQRRLFDRATVFFYACTNCWRGLSTGQSSLYKRLGQPWPNL